MKWIESIEKKHPTNKDNLENYLITRSNVYLGVLIINDKRLGDIEVVEPIYLNINEFSQHYWVDAYDDKVNPIRWCLMPSPN